MDLTQTNQTLHAALRWRGWAWLQVAALGALLLGQVSPELHETFFHGEDAFSDCDSSHTASADKSTPISDDERASHPPCPLCGAPQGVSFWMPIGHLVLRAPQTSETPLAVAPVEITFGAPRNAALPIRGPPVVRIGQI